MRTAVINIVLAIGFLLNCTFQVLAQPLFPHAESIESTVVNADLVVIAKLVDFRRAQQDKEAGGCQGTIDIEETLKQDDSLMEEPYRKLSLHIPRPAAEVLGWKERSSRLLIAYNSEAPDQVKVIELVPEKLEVMSAEIELIRDPEVALRLARKTVGSVPANIKRLHTFNLYVPRENVTGTRWERYYATGGHLLLSVPVDQELEKRAKDYIRSKNPHRRAEGAKALVYFKSDENIEIVKPLLSDPEPTSSQPASDDQAGVRYFGVRHSAYRTLKSWGVDVKQPVFRES